MMPVPPDSTNKEECSEFHVVGVGASAGGLEAIEALFRSLPTDSGVAFVIVQHLSPDFKSHMEELLARQTNMSIHRVENGMEVEPNSIYLIPPKMEMVISKGKLLLTEKDVERTLSHPIDQFFRSLASDIGRYAIGVVLSGTGSDGSRGIRDIHDAGGLVLAQDEDSAKFDGMPLNAQATGVVDLVVPPEGIAEALIKYVRDGLSPEAIAKEELLTTTAGGVDRIFQLLHQQHGLDFSHYKASTVGRRIQRRVDLLSLSNVDEYISYVEKDASELNSLYKDLLIGVTKFFRDPDAFDVIAKEVIPKLFEPQNLSIVRVWVAGCASGEEAYSLAILLDEEKRRRNVQVEIKVFATDAHHISLNAAARAVYSEEALSELSIDRKRQYFRKKRDGYHVAAELRRYVIFAPHNVISDAPFTQMDLVSCRNLLIYLQPAAQKKALSLFHFALKSQGTLFLGTSETPGELSDEFEAIDSRWRIYSKKRDVRLPFGAPISVGLPTGRGARLDVTPIARNVARVDDSLIGTYDRLLDRKMPPSILVNENHDILHIFGGAERFIQPRGGRPTNRLLDVVADSLKTPLTGALQHAMRKQDIVRYTGIHVPTPDGYENVQLSVEPIRDDRSNVTNLLVEIESIGPVDAPSGEETVVDLNQMTSERIAGLESELRFSQENLQATVEEMETSNEELQATNEELVASTEELQSTNEELHSVNEELYTVNAEHQRRIEELAEANSDMDNLLATTRVGVIFLDDELFIRRFTPEIGRLFHLVPEDIGRSIEGFTTRLKHDSLIEDLKDVFKSKEEKEVTTQDQQGSRFLLRMMPYRSGTAVAGVVMTLIDITNLRDAQMNAERFRYMSESATDGQALVDQTGQLVYANPSLCESLGYERDELVTLSLMDISSQLDHRAFHELFEQTSRVTTEPYETDWLRKDGSLAAVEISASSVLFAGQRYLFASVRDTSNRRVFEAEMRTKNLAVDAARDGILITDPTAEDNPVVYANLGFCTLTGYSLDEVIGKNCRFLQGVETDPDKVQTIREAVARGEACRTTLRNHRKDGTAFWNDLHITPIHDKAGRLRNFVGVTRDVTDRIEAEAKSRRYTEQIQAILDTTAEGIYGLDREGNCTFCNRAALELLGYKSADELIGKNMHQLIHHTRHDGVEYPEHECKIYQATREVAPSHVDDEILWRADRSSFAAEYWSCPLIRDDEVVGAVVTFQDISERLAVATRLEQLGKMVNASRDAIIAWELGGNILSWNDGAAELYGYTAEQAIGQETHQLLRTIHSVPFDEIDQAIRLEGEWSGILEHQTASGERVTVSSRHQLLRMPNGESQVLEINRDITEQSKLQKALEKASRLADEANKAKSAFLANMSHELRTPLTAVLGFADMLFDKVDTPDLMEHVDTIKRNGNYLLTLLNDILDLSKIEAGKMNFDTQAIDIREVIEHVRSLMGVRAREHGIPLRFEWKTECPSRVTADPVRVRQILVNLVSNALKFTNAGEVRVTIEVNRDAQPPTLEIAVQDTGIGISAEQQASLFEPFTQASQFTAQEFGGTGLGLSISKRLANAMNGSITVTSQVGEGSTFTFALPVTEEQLQSVHPVSESLQAGGGINVDSVSEHIRIQANILLADDRRDVWRVAQYFLERCGADVTIAENGRQAVDMAMDARDQRKPFDLILMDMQMPVMTGQEAVSELRHHGFKTPIIALTADAMTGEREACMKIGCDEYLAKPIDGKKLTKLVASVLTAAGSK